MTHRLALRSLRVAGACGLLLVGVIGFAHTPAGRPMLGVVGRAFRGGACPLGYDRAATPAMREQTRASFARAHRGLIPAVGRPALGFDLDRTTRAEVVKFMAVRGIACQPSSSMADLICSAVPSAALSKGARSERKLDLWFNFGQEERLITVIASSRERTAAGASAAFSDTTERLAREAGPASRVSGEGDPVFLAAGTLRQASREFAFANYFASARATNMGQDFMLTEEYRSLPGSPN